MVVCRHFNLRKSIENKLALHNRLWAVYRGEVQHVYLMVFFFKDYLIFNIVYIIRSKNKNYIELNITYYFDDR